MGVEIKIDLWRCFYVLKRNMLLIILVAMLFFVLAFLFTMDEVGNTYRSAATVYSTAEGGYSYTQAVETSSAMQRYVEVVRSQKVLNRAAELLKDPNITAQELSQIVSVSYESTSYILNLYATSSSPTQSVAVVNAVAASFVSEITAITGKNNVQVLDTATSYTMIRNGSRTQWLTRLAVAGIAGAVTALFLLLKDILSKRLHTLKDIYTSCDLEVLGIIPDLSGRMREEREVVNETN